MNIYDYKYSHFLLTSLIHVEIAPVLGVEFPMKLYFIPWFAILWMGIVGFQTYITTFIGKLAIKQRKITPHINNLRRIFQLWIWKVIITLFFVSFIYLKEKEIYLTQNWKAESLMVKVDCTNWLRHDEIRLELEVKWSGMDIHREAWLKRTIDFVNTYPTGTCTMYIIPNDGVSSWVKSKLIYNWSL